MSLFNILKLFFGKFKQESKKPEYKSAMIAPIDLMKMFREEK